MVYGCIGLLSIRFLGLAHSNESPAYGTRLVPVALVLLKARAAKDGLGAMAWQRNSDRGDGIVANDAYRIAC